MVGPLVNSIRAGPSSRAACGTSSRTVPDAISRSPAPPPRSTSRRFRRTPATAAGRSYAPPHPCRRSRRRWRTPTCASSGTASMVPASHSTPTKRHQRASTCEVFKSRRQIRPHQDRR